MKLNIVDNNAKSFNEAVGISIERATELTEYIGKMIKECEGKNFIVPKAFNNIAGMCNNPEELVYCVINCCSMLASAYGIILHELKVKP